MPSASDPHGEAVGLKKFRVCFIFPVQVAKLPHLHLLTMVTHTYGYLRQEMLGFVALQVADKMPLDIPRHLRVSPLLLLNCVSPPVFLVVFYFRKKGMEVKKPATSARHCKWQVHRHAYVKDRHSLLNHVLQFKQELQEKEENVARKISHLGRFVAKLLDVVFSKVSLACIHTMRCTRHESMH
jgi:hypothetical protein